MAALTRPHQLLPIQNVEGWQASKDEGGDGYARINGVVNSPEPRSLSRQPTHPEAKPPETQWNQPLVSKASAEEAANE